MSRRLVLPALVLALASAVALSAVATAAPTRSEAPTASKATIVGVAAGDKRFTTLVALVKQADLAMTLSAKGPYTVFAPTNAAFAKLKRTAPDTYSAVASDPKLLRKVLTYHVLASRVPSTAALAAAKKGASVKTVQGEKIRLSLKGGKIVLNGSSRVVVADVKATNGVIHVIDTVLVPPSLS